jgi:hypothetical protein
MNDDGPIFIFECTDCGAVSMNEYLGDFDEDNALCLECGSNNLTFEED